jgi:hypothetical protein
MTLHGDSSGRSDGTSPLPWIAGWAVVAWAGVHGVITLAWMAELQSAVVAGASAGMPGLALAIVPLVLGLDCLVFGAGASLLGAQDAPRRFRPAALGAVLTLPWTLLFLRWDSPVSWIAAAVALAVLGLVLVALVRVGGSARASTNAGMSVGSASLIAEGAIALAVSAAFAGAAGSQAWLALHQGDLSSERTDLIGAAIIVALSVGSGAFAAHILGRVPRSWRVLAIEVGSVAAAFVLLGAGILRVAPLGAAWCGVSCLILAGVAALARPDSPGDRQPHQ